MPLNDRNLKLASQIGPLLQITHTTPLSNPSMLVSTDTVPYQTAPHHTTPNPQPYTHPSQNLKPKPHKIPLRIPTQQATPQTQQAAPPGRPQPTNHPQCRHPDPAPLTAHYPKPATPHTCNPRYYANVRAPAQPTSTCTSRTRQQRPQSTSRVESRESRLHAHLDDDDDDDEDDDDDNACKSPQGNQPRTTAPTDRPTRE